LVGGADTSNVALPEKYLKERTIACGPVMHRDWAMCRYLTLEYGVACIPPSAFYMEQDKPLAKNMVRFAFCKEDASLVEAGTRLRGLRSHLIDPALAPASTAEGDAAAPRRSQVQ
jgi:aspartate/methionine/tyrosine aminotransferase